MALFERAAANCVLVDTGTERCPSTFGPNSSHPVTVKSSRRDAKADRPIRLGYIQLPMREVRAGQVPAQLLTVARCHCIPN